MGASAPQIRLGLIGAGSVAANYHLPVLQSVSGVRLQWIADPVTSKARELAKVYGIPQVEASLADCGEVDAVLVGTPLGVRKPIIETIAERGWHAMVEKPFAANTADHEWMLELARKRSLVLGVGLVRRHYETTRRARKIMAAELLGPVHEILAGEGMRARKSGRGGDWYQGSADASGGVLFETGSHLIDMAFLICGVEAFELEHCEQQLSGALEVETRALAWVTLKKGERVPMRIAVSRLADVYNGIVIRCQNGELRVPADPERSVDLCARGGEVVGSLPGAPKPGMTPALVAEWNEFVAHVARRDASLDTGLLTTSFIEKCYRMARDSKPARRGLS
ncbi:MAG TPA: Gfo/Idh/MocA family oxidoreductase [Polyangiaceae bacterium]|nr:Gfo/Idh/MocA family oxidoreductase [Polyangiaceae bacterium]